MPLSSSHIEDAFSSKEEGVKRLLSCILNLNLQDEANEKLIISVINRLLSTAKHRREGLEYLNLIINNCSLSTVCENAIIWANHCIIKFAGDILRELKLTVLGKIIEVAHTDSEFNKKIVSDYMPKVLESCTTTTHVNSYECKTSLKTLTSAMKYYPSWFGAHKQKIEKYILIFLESDNADLVETAGLAFHYLQQIGSGGPNGVNHKSNFTQSFHKLCRTVHKLYNKLFENEGTVFNTEFSTDDDNVYEFQDDPSSDTQFLLHINAKRIRNSLRFIKIMIKTRFPVAKETKPKELLEVITRGMSVHKCISRDSTDSLETYQFSLLLTEIQCRLLKILRLFIIWYESNALPFSYSISKLIIDSIERSHDCECFKYDSHYQESSYRAVSEWLYIAKSSFHSQFQSQLLICILKDITPVKTQITLTISDTLSGKKSQKAKRKAVVNRIISSGNQTLSAGSNTHYEKTSEKSTCKFALNALKHLLELTRLTVKPNLLKDLYKSIFDSLISIQTSNSLHPYTDFHCQAKLYEVLVAIFNQNTVSVLPPLHTSLDILTRGSNQSNHLISDICQKGLRVLEVLCQPICPSLYIGKEKDDFGDEPSDVQEEDEDMIVDVSKDEDSMDVSFRHPSYSMDVSFRHPSSIYEAEQKTNEPSFTDTLPGADTNEASEYLEIEPRVKESERSDRSCQEEELKGKVTQIVKSTDVLEENCLLSSESQQETITNGSSAIQNEVSDATGAESENKNIPIPEVSSSNGENQVSDEVVVESDNPNIPELEVSSLNVTSSVDNTQQPVNAEEKEKENSDLLPVDSGEPPNKKARTELDDESDMGDEFDENRENSKKRKKADEDSDENIFEDDSFVDEVKDYY